MHTATPASHLGKLVDRRYRLERLVGEGASSWVFAATDQRLQREVALKLFKPAGDSDDPERRKRCVAEGHTLAKLVHPHIVAIHDGSEDGSGQMYLVMELCEAGTLEGELAVRGRLALDETLRLALPLMGALAFAHDRNIVHRDIKPGNIVLVEERGERRCKLLDFGISLGAGVRTSSELVPGTPGYMAPELVRGEPATPASDVWALGVVLFRCLAGRLPFEADNSADMVQRILHGRAPRLSSVCDGALAPNVMQALDRALDPNSARRYADMRSFARALATTCVLDGVSLLKRPEPIGLPEFDTWLRAARDSTTTAPMAIAGAEPRASATHERSGVRWSVRAALATAVTAIFAGGVLALSKASERSLPSAPASSGPAECVEADDARVLGPVAAEAELPLQSAPSAHEGPSAATLPAPSLADVQAPPAKAPKRKKIAARPGQSADCGDASATPCIIMSWDW